MKTTYDDSFFTSNETNRIKSINGGKKSQNGTKKQLTTINQSKENLAMLTSSQGSVGPNKANVVENKEVFQSKSNRK